MGLLALFVLHCVKSVRIRSFSGTYFPAFRLNTERYGLPFGIQSECGKYGPEKLQLRTPFTQCYLRFRKSSENAIISRKNILCLNIRSHEKYLDRCVWNICKIKTHVVF